MIWHLLAVFIMALCMGGLALGLRRLTRNRLPRWLVPASAAAGMFGYLAYYDYAWYDFKRGQLPADAKVIAERRDPSFFRPWSYVYPSVSAFTVLDGRFAAQIKDQQRLVQYLAYTFRQDPIEGLDTRAFVLNCSTRERVQMDRASNRLTGAVDSVQPDDVAYRNACP